MKRTNQIYKHYGATPVTPVQAMQAIQAIQAMQVQEIDVALDEAPPFSPPFSPPDDEPLDNANVRNPHMMIFFMMIPRSPHSHRVHEPNKPKEWFPEQDVEYTLQVLIVLPPDNSYLYWLEGLDEKPHCSLPVSELNHVTSILDEAEIPRTIVGPKMPETDISAKPFEAAVRYRGNAVEEIRSLGVEDDLLGHLISDAKNGKLTKDAKRQSLKD